MERYHMCILEFECIRLENTWAQVWKYPPFLGEHIGKGDDKPFLEEVTTGGCCTHVGLKG